MIRKPFNFWIGVFCGMCFILGIALHRDMSVLVISAFATVVNIAIGLTG